MVDDDGGANKSSVRLYRRKARRCVTILLFSSIFLIFGWVILLRKWYPVTTVKYRIKNMTTSYKKHHENGHNGTERESEGGGNYRWVDPRQLPPLVGYFDIQTLQQFGRQLKSKRKRQDSSIFSPNSQHKQFPWERLSTEELNRPPKIDYTKHSYIYPDIMPQPPQIPQDTIYPPLESLGDIFLRWPQDNLDSPPNPFVERLQHFDYTKPEDMQAATRYRDLELPFKIFNVPELAEANQKWTIDYLSQQFDHYDSDPHKSQKGEAVRLNNANLNSEKDPSFSLRRKKQKKIHNAALGQCEESDDNFFAFYVKNHWDQSVLGPYPTIMNNFSFRRFANHAQYADSFSLPPDQKHYYYQAGVDREERLRPMSHWSFISLDLPSFSSPNPTFFGFNPSEQKGIQCRFGERGVVAATHYDAGRNMIAMITGAKRYILAPPKECSKLGILTNTKSGGYRHSYLNFGHISLLQHSDLQTKSMPMYEKSWLERAKDSVAIDTVLKAGEVLYVPSHWFHYIISLQRSAQCNTRSGREVKGHPYFGGLEDVEHCS